jgi:cyclomaltodextrinase
MSARTRGVRPLLAALLLASPLASAAAEACRPAPLGTRVLYLRGSFNDWRADDDSALRYACDHYELVARLKGEQRFKVGDEDWSADADLGGASELTLAPGTPVPLVPKGAGLRAVFGGVVRITLTPAATPGGAPLLAIADLPADTALPEPAGALTDPVARSLSFDSRTLADKSPFGAVTAGSEVSFDVGALPGVDSVTLVVEKRRLEGNYDLLAYDELARVPLARTSAGPRERWTARYRFGDPAIYGYWFEVRVGERVLVLQNNDTPVYWTQERGAGGAAQVAELPASRKRIRRYRQTVYAADFRVPAWARDAVYYYIFPERLRNGDARNDPKPGVDRYQDQAVEFHQNWLDRPWKPGSGDGSDAVYNNDFFGGDIAGIIQKLDYIKSIGANTLYITPMFTAASNHKYDTADYTHIDPHFGSNEDFARLCAEAARRGIRVLPDASFNHVGADSIYFDRFGTRGGQGAFSGNRVNPASPYASWFSFDTSQADPGKQFKGWVGVADLPEIDKSSPSFRAFAFGAPDSVTKTWLARGAAGWRMDVAPWVPDDFWRAWRVEVKRTKPDALTVSETWFDAAKFLLGDEFDSTMNYIFRNAVMDYANGGDATLMAANLELLRENYPPPAFAALMNLLSTHDAARALHVFGDVDGKATPAEVAQAKQKLRLAMFFQMTYPGAPAIYYGDEVGMTGGDDPMNRAAYPWADRGGHPDLGLLADVRRLVKLRRDLPVLRHGTLLAPLHVDAHVVVLARRDGDAWAISSTNNADTPRTVTIALPAGAPAGPWRDALAARRLHAAGHTLTLLVPARFGTLVVATAKARP